MSLSVEVLTIRHVEAVEELRKRSARTLGFFPYEALKEHLKSGTVLGIRTENGWLTGYLLFAKNAQHFRIVHLCVDEGHRGKGLARKLFDELKRLRTTQTTIKLSCRRDFPANKVWLKLGFVPIGEKSGRSKAGHMLTLWQYNLGESDQLEIFRAKIIPEAQDVVLDAQVFFDFEEPSRPASEPSRALLADFLVDLLEYWVTDEILAEINRNENIAERNLQRQRADLHIVPHNQQVAEHYADVLSNILPARTDSQKSDILHLAKTAASHVRVFVTRDRGLLRESEKIQDGTGIRVVAPTQIIVECHEAAEKEAYLPSYVSGQDFAWSRVTSDDIPHIPWDAFLRHGERLGRFGETVLSFAANPERFSCEVLRSDTDVCAVRVIERKQNTLVVHLARTEKTARRPLFERFLATDALYGALASNLQLIEFKRGSLGENLISHALEIGFLEHDEKYFRLCLPSCGGRKDFLSLVTNLLPHLSAKYGALPANELEQYCSPADLKENEKSYVIVPIKPGYAISLFDRQQAGTDLFGGDKSTLLRWDNVYYRRISHQNILRTPARILWYESAPEGKVTTLSNLDNVELGMPGDLLRKYKKLGILEWRDLYRMCSGDVEAQLMALKFSHTFPLQRSVPLAELRDILNTPRLTFQSPHQVTRSEYRKIVEVGF